MFEMKYLINRMQCYTYHYNYDRLMVVVFAFILKVKGSNLTDGVFVVNSGKLIKYSPMWFFRISVNLS